MIEDGNPTPEDSPEAETLVDDGSRLPSSTAIDGGRFAPGLIVDARYRIVALLGRGGMGEVYRAEDMKLGEPVALKFLPESLAGDGAALARFHREVRTARQITHRNIVRVHDIGEVDSMPFITMEYVDGEDLSSLLKRIGRLPQDKAVELSRQLCAGLAAAHDRGVLHRDLKPANVMIDGEGRAKISDFGLADLAAELQPEFAGTPAYMAPEQLDAGHASFASDIYSLGLVLYEMFTGRPAFSASSRAELQQLHHSTDPDAISTEVPGMDPLVEGVLQRCLQREPQLRPGSALEVAAALPGGDPLAAALAAGETPSPEMVARVGGQAALSPRVAAGLLALSLAGLAAVVSLYPRILSVGIGPPLEPQVLAHKARQILETEGWQGSDSAWGYTDNRSSISSDRRSRPLAEWRALAAQRPTFHSFWYRGSEGPLLPSSRWGWRVQLDDPPLATEGLATIQLDGTGRLRSLLIPRALTAGGDAIEPDWRPYFEAAELDLDAFTETVPDRSPPVFADRVRSWHGSYPGQAAPELRVDAASLNGSAIWWRIREAGSEAALRSGARALQLQTAVALTVFALLWAVGGWFAYRHWQSGRGDPRGALRLAAFVLAWQLLSWVLLSKHALAVSELSLAFAAIGQSLMLATVFWLLYMTIEPFVRKFWPRQLTSWVRLLSGDVRNPLVGRDLLIGIVVGICTLTVEVVLELTGGGVALQWSTPHGLRPLYGAGEVLAGTLHFMTPMVALGVMTVLVLSRVILRRSTPAILAALLLVTAFAVFGGGDGTIKVANLIAPVAMVLLASRVGLLATVGMTFATANLHLVPVGADPSIWWTPVSAISWGAVALVAVTAYRISTRGDAPARAS